MGEWYLRPTGCGSQVQDIRYVYGREDRYAQQKERHYTSTQFRAAKAVLKLNGLV